jgi:hypothetical protein
MRRRLIILVGFVIGALAGSSLYRRSFARRPERIDVYYDDGSMVSYVDGSSEADSLLPAARDALAATRR